MKLKGFTILMLVGLISSEEEVDHKRFRTAENKHQKRGIFGLGFGGPNFNGYGSKPSSAPSSIHSKHRNEHDVQSEEKESTPKMEIHSHIPIPYENKVHVPYPVKVHIPVYVSKPHPVPVVKHVPYPVVKRIPYPVKVPVKVPVKIPVPIIVPKPYFVRIPKKIAVPVKVPYIVEQKVPVSVSMKNHRGLGTNLGSPRQGGWF